MIEQIFIMISKGVFTVEYLGIRNIDEYTHMRGDGHWTRLMDFEILLIENGFTQVTKDANLHIWTRKGEQLALGAHE